MEGLRLYNNKVITIGIPFLFIFQAIFISVRLWLVGEDSAASLLEYFISFLPELFLLGIVLYTAIQFRKENARFNLFIYDKVILFYIVSNVLIGAYLSADLRISLQGFRLTYLPMLFYFVGRYFVTYNETKIERLLDLIFWSYAVIALIGLIFYFLIPQWEWYFTSLSGGRLNYYHIKRMGSIFWTPVIWGTFMSAASLYYYYKMAKKFSWFDFSLFSLFWFCLFISVSRGAIIPFFIILLLFTINFKAWFLLLKSFVAMALLLILMIFYNPKTSQLLGFISSSSIETVGSFSSESTQNYILNKEQSEDIVLEDSTPISPNQDAPREKNKLKSDNSRARLWAESIKDFMNKPSGYGLGKSGHVAHQNFGEDSDSASVYSTDGWYLKLANETGIWGLFSYSILFLVFCYLSVVYWSKNKKSLVVFLFGVFLSVAIQNIMSNVLDFYSFAYFYWLIIGISYHILIAEKKECQSK